MGVGLGKTLQMGGLAKLIGTLDDDPVLIVAPNAVVSQWQEETIDKLAAPGALWTSRGWLIEHDEFHPATENDVLNCPRKIFASSPAVSLPGVARLICFSLEALNKYSRMQFNFSSSPDSDNGLLLEAGLFAGRRYRLGTSICENPGCQCEHVTLYCFPETKEPPQSHPSAPICLEMDLARRAIANLEDIKADSAAFTLAKAIESEITEAEWAKLRNLYFAVKQDATDHVDPDQIDADFASEVLTGDGSMVGYYEILPYARPVEFPLGAGTWLLDDQYCVVPTCSCREVALSFLPLRSSTGAGSSPAGPLLSLRYDYDIGRIEPLSSADALGFSAQEFINALKSAQPDLNSLLAQRHVLLRHLFRRALNRKTLRLSAPKPGRNDPCPCGSGKKYKKCCGA